MDLLPVFDTLSANDKLRTRIRLDKFKLFDPTNELQSPQSGFVTYFSELHLIGFNPSRGSGGPLWSEILSADGVPYTAIRMGDLCAVSPKENISGYWVIGPAHGKIMAACRYAASQVSSWDFSTFREFVNKIHAVTPADIVSFLDEECSKISKELAETKNKLAAAQENQLVALEEAAKYKTMLTRPAPKAVKSSVGVIISSNTITVAFGSKQAIRNRGACVGLTLFDLRTIKCTYDTFWEEMWKDESQIPLRSVNMDGTHTWNILRMNENDVTRVLWRVANADARITAAMKKA